MSKKRLDSLLVDLGLASDITHAQKLILAGEVFINEERIAKAGTLLDQTVSIRLKNKPTYASRAGEKLKGAIDHFKIPLKGMIAIDLGASTGGFTDCLLKEGAEKVYAVDVGKNELAWQLRSDPRVIALSGVNARYLDQCEDGMFLPSPQIGVVDLSFISATLVLPGLKKIIANNSNILVLVKPQFELSRDQIEQGGIVTDPALHNLACSKVEQSALHHGFKVHGRYESPLKGLKKKNTEFFLHLSTN